MKSALITWCFIPKLYCNLFGHDYEVTRKVTYHVKEYTCRHCKRELTTNSNGNLIELTPKFREINSILEKIYMRKALRLSISQGFDNSNLRITA